MFALDELTHNPVNWTDGMRVSASDFAKGDLAWADGLRDVRATLFQGRQFGLLPPLRDSSDQSAYPKIDFVATSTQLVLKECRAITSGGYRIEITEHLQGNYSIPLNFPSVQIDKREDFSVYITVDMFDPKAAGKLLSSAPPRHEFVCPFYELSVLYESDEIGLAGFNHLKIGEYQYAAGSFKRNEAFIPDCMTIDTHALLLKRFLKAGSQLKSIHDNGISIINQYRLDGRQEARDAVAWGEKIVLFIAQHLWTYNDLLKGQSPGNTITFFKNLGQVVLTAIDLHEDNNYLKANAKSQRHYFKDLADPNFGLSDLKTSFDRIRKTLQVLDSWFKALSETLKDGRVIRVEDMS